MRRLFFLFLVLLLAAAPAVAGIRGVVTDQAGKPLPGALMALHQAEGRTYRLTAGAAGAYSILKLPAGNYTATYSAPGFEARRYKGISIRPSGTGVRLDVQLQKSGSWGGSITTHIYNSVQPDEHIKRKPSYKARTAAHAPVAEPERSPMLAPPLPEAARAIAPVADRIKPGGSSAKAEERLERSASRSKSEAPVIYRSIEDGVSTGGGRSAGAKYVVDDIASAGEHVVMSAPGARAGSLTSGEINDFSKWTLWQDLSMAELKSYRSAWPFRPEARYTVLIKTKEGGAPLCNVRVRMHKGGSTIWETVTDNTGKAELWYGMWDTAAPPAELSASIDYGGRRFTQPALKPAGEGANILVSGLSCLNPAKLDIAFIVDATGSMQDEIDYLKAELRDILRKVKDSMPEIQVQTGAVFYRDESDAYITRSTDLSADFSRTEAFISDNNADGGGDFPEALDAALEEGLNGLSWRADATTRLAFLVLDAPPHNDAATIKRMQSLTAQYAARGIRLIPVVCSGSDKSTEYLLRSMALATNGTYLFLTDHSGIGGGHVAPTTDKYDVEYLNGLIYRVIYQCTYMPPCKPLDPGKSDTLLVREPTSDSAKTITWRYYPNPTTSGILHIEHSHTSGFLLISDITGKAVMRVPADPSGRTTVDLGQYPAGIYAIRYNMEGDKWVSGKFVVVH